MSSMMSKKGEIKHEAEKLQKMSNRKPLSLKKEKEEKGREREREREGKGCGECGEVVL